MKKFFGKDIQQIYNNVKRQVIENPRKCDVCGAVETIDNLILLYDNGKYMCDDCMLDYDFEED